MSIEEREDREQMGELPEPIFREREGRYPQAPLAPRFARGQRVPRVPPDIGYQDRTLGDIAESGRVGNIDIPWGVDPTYDVLPPNGEGFNIKQRLTVNISTPPGVNTLEITVPLGRVFVVRSVEIEYVEFNSGGPQPTGFLPPLEEGDFASGTFATFLLDGSPDNENQNLLFTGFQDIFETYTIVGGNQVFGVRLSVDPDELGEDVQFIIKVSGDNLQSNKYPDQYAPNLKGANTGV